MITKILQRLKGDLTPPFFGLLGFVFLIVLVQRFALGPLSGQAQGIAALNMWIGLSWWLMDDARRLRITLPMVYGIMIIYCPLIYLPLYLFETRGALAFVTLALYLFALVGLAIVSHLVF